MRRIDVFGIGIGIFFAGGVVYAILQTVGLDQVNAGIWTQVALVAGLVGWLSTYVFRAAGGTMTYHQQRKAYEDAVLQKRFDSLTPEELATLRAEIAAEATASTAEHEPQHEP